MILNTTPEDRKPMVKAISELIGVPAVYMRTPTYAFQIGEITVNRDGTTESANEELLHRIAPMLVENGWLTDEAMPAAETPDVPAQETAPAPAPQEDEAANTANVEPDNGEADTTQDADTDSEEIDHTEISLYEPNWELYSMKNLIRILYTRQCLINRMLKMDCLHIDEEVINILNDGRFLCVSDLETMVHDEQRCGMIEGFDITGGKLTMTMPYDDLSAERWMYYSQLMTAIIKQAKESRRTKAEKLEPDNDKYYANAWLARLGFTGSNYKPLRHFLMDHLNGYAAFKDNDRMQAHKDKLAEQRRIRREVNEEGDANE